MMKFLAEKNQPRNKNLSLFYTPISKKGFNFTLNSNGEFVRNVLLEDKVLHTAQSMQIKSI